MIYARNQVDGSASRARFGAPAGRYALPISKLRSVPARVRLALKVHRITTCERLLEMASLCERRAGLARLTQVPLRDLEDLVRRADMARVNGIGVVFGLMLEDLGVRDSADLAACEPSELHQRLRRYNQNERLARRSPTPDEVVDWVSQARRLPVLLTWPGPLPVAAGQ